MSYGCVPSVIPALGTMLGRGGKQGWQESLDHTSIHHYSDRHRSPRQDLYIQTINDISAQNQQHPPILLKSYYYRDIYAPLDLPRKVDLSIN